MLVDPARRLKQALDTAAHIHYEFEGVSPAGNHKPNTAVAQAYYNKQEGTKRLTTETGAGRWAPPWPSPAPSTRSTPTSPLSRRTA